MPAKRRPTKAKPPRARKTKRTAAKAAVRHPRAAAKRAVGKKAARGKAASKISRSKKIAGASGSKAAASSRRRTSADRSAVKTTKAKAKPASRARAPHAVPVGSGRRGSGAATRSRTASPTKGRARSGALGFVKTTARSVRRATRRLVRAVTPASGRGARAAAAGSPSAARGRVRPGMPRGVIINGKAGPRYDEILTREALAFLADLHRRFEPTRRQLLQARADQQARYDAGALPDFLPETRLIRDDDWKVAPIPSDLLDRRVEITGPVDRKMVINALNSGAKVYMADFEDANSPTWPNNIEGQINLKDRWAGTLDFTDPSTSKDYRLGEQPAVMIVRPRGWHLPEAHLTIDGDPVSAALFDFALYFFHNAEKQVAQGTGPYFYLPKLETHLEARLWNEVFVHAQEKLDMPVGTIKATVLIETLPAAFAMDEILWELRDHIAGLNAGRWDYIFSFIKKLKRHPEYVLPDRGQVIMGEAFLGAYAALLVRTCHRRGAFAMGGMAAQIPIKNDRAANEAAFAKVRADKEREVRDGYDGTWVAHPDLVPVAKEVFDRMMPQPNQLDRIRLHVRVLRDDLLKVHQGTKTEDGFRLN